MNHNTKGGVDFFDPEGEYEVAEEIAYMPVLRRKLPLPVMNPHEGIIMGFSNTKIVVLRTKTQTTEIIDRSQIIAPSGP